MAIVRYTGADKVNCPQCTEPISPRLLICPNCNGLVHAARLKALATEAELAEANQKYAYALETWRSALALLPPDTKQAQTIQARLERLSAKVDSGHGDKPKSVKGRDASWKSAGGVLAGIGFLLWKFKFIAIFLGTKIKLLLLGLTKASTFFSMLLSMGLYWSLWGWKFAVGIVLCIYVHEMGHVAALRRFGIKASAPMFIPGFGAMVRLRQYPANAIEDARVGLAGPIWGAAAALVCYGIHFATGAPFWAALAKFSAWINLFNLLPVWQLDGARGLRALDGKQRWILVGFLFAIWVTTGEGLLFLIGAVAVVRALMKDRPEKGDLRALIEFMALAAGLALLSQIPVDVGTAPAEPQPLVQ